MQRRRVWIRSMLLVLGMLTSLALAGCKGSHEFPTAVVVGRVTYKGKPVPNGTVMFVPNGNGPTASGELRSDGTYSMTTYDPGDGAVIDTHKVSITALSFGSNALPEAMNLPPPLIPDKYFFHLTSGLTADVREQDENVINFDLTD